jgi:hypothetical protein
MDDYLNRALGVIEGMSQLDWASLSELTQGWFNVALAASDDGKPLPRFTDVLEEYESKDSEEAPAELPATEPIADERPIERKFGSDAGEEDEEEESDEEDDEAVFFKPPPRVGAQRASMRTATGCARSWGEGCRARAAIGSAWLQVTAADDFSDQVRDADIFAAIDCGGDFEGF